MERVFPIKTTVYISKYIYECVTEIHTEMYNENKKNQCGLSIQTMFSTSRNY